MYNKFMALVDKKRITVYRVAKETGLPTSLFSEWKNGKSTPKIDKIMKIADYFGVPIEYFYEKERV